MNYNNYIFIETEQSCGKPPIIANGSVSVVSTKNLSTAIYTCDDGFVIDNSESKIIYCSADFKWPPDVPVCISK